MSRSFCRDRKRPWCFRRVVNLVGTVVIVIPLLAVGTIAVLHLVGLHKEHPLVRLVIVIGHSMDPTFAPGEQLLCVRRGWEPGSIVIADVGEKTPVVKRVVSRQDDSVYITGDNAAVTASYTITPDKIIAVYVCRTGLKFPPTLRPGPLPKGRGD
jgi:signal peptidase I